MRDLSIGRAWDEAKAALAANRKLIVPVALGMVLLPAVLISMVEPQVPTGQQPPAGAWMLLAFAMVLVMIVGELAIVLLVNGWRGSVGEAIGRAGRRMPILILAGLTIIIPVILLLSLLLVLAGLSTDAAGQIDWRNLGGGAWLMLLACMLALFFIGVRLLPMIAVVASETVGPISAIRRSFALTSGHFSRLLAFLLMLMIAFVVVAATVGVVVGSAVELLFGEPRPWSLSMLLIALTGGLVQAGFVMVYIAMLARIYAQLAAPEAGVPDVSRDSSA